MKNATNSGFDQHYNVQVVVEHDSRLIVGDLLLNQANDKQAALPTIDSVPPEIGKPENANLDNGYFSEDNIKACETAKITPYISFGKERHNQPIEERFKEADPLPDDPTALERMKHRLQTKEGKQIYAERKSTVEPVFGIIKHVMGFRQFMLRGFEKAQGEWDLVCIAYNLKRLHKISLA